MSFGSWADPTGRNEKQQYFMSKLQNKKLFKDAILIYSIR